MTSKHFQDQLQVIRDAIEDEDFQMEDVVDFLNMLERNLNSINYGRQQQEATVVVYQWVKKMVQKYEPKGIV